MCGATTVYYKCGHYGNVHLEFCGKDPRPTTERKDLERLASLGCVKEFTAEYQQWCGLASDGFKLPPMIFAPRICRLCRDEKRNVAREKKSEASDSSRRYDWKSQKETRPTYSEMVKKEEAQAEEDPYYRAQCTKPWNDPFADSDKEWQQREDIDEDTWREKRNEVMGWE